MLNNAQRKLGFREVIYNMKNGKFFAHKPGDQYSELDISIGSGGDVDAIQPGRLPVVSVLPTEDMVFGDMCALSTDNYPYFYDGTDWRQLYLTGLPDVPDTPDDDWDSVILRVPLDSTFNDVKNNRSPEANDGVTLVGSPSRFGGGSAKFVPDTYITYDSTYLQDFLNNQFTVEFWIYFNSFTVYDDPITIFSKGDINFTYRYSSAGVQISVYKSGESIGNWYETVSLSEGTWYFFSYSRNALTGLMTLHIDGQPSSTLVSGNNLLDGVNDDLSFGDGSDAGNADIYLDDIRVSTIERYESDQVYNVPTEQLPVI